MCDGRKAPLRRQFWTMVAGRVALLSLFLVAAECCYLFPSDVPNPCVGVSCGPGAQCRPTPDGRSHTCECPSSCPSYGDHEGSRPLCASDARDYPGDCEMRRAACDSNTNITFKYYGKCDPCAGVTCPDPEVCQLDDHRSPSCRCAEPCPLEFSPVCASDGKTYSNECQMHRESCRARKQLKIIFKGQCSTGVNPCAEVECRHGAECRVEGGGAVCACPPPCEPVLRPVCGSDARTHDSECELRRAACLLGRELKVLHAGACGSNGVCTERVCPHGGECVATGGRGVCRCPRCSNEFAPVCGSDGISYGNRCKLQLEACRHRRDVRVLYVGPCNGCENKKCEYYAVCESDGVSEASCVCPKHCEEGTETEEVCGNDNKTYSSVCALRDVACREKKRLHIKHMGSCESCLSVQCPSGTWCARGSCACANPCADAEREPVCSNTGLTYLHECALQKAACEARMRGEPPLRVAYYGECTENQEENGTIGTNKTVKVTDITNEIRSGDENPESSSEPGVGTAVCARVQCAYEATCAVDSNGQPRCACLFDCAAAAAAATSSNPVCASDLRLYPTLCHMKLEACRRQEDLRLRPLALCRGLEFRPCGDDEPITDAEGRPVDCGGGPHRKDCPIGSYCHHTAKAARCCRKDKTVVEKKGCQDSWHGCCADGVTPARGPGGAGCPSQCGCHRLGSVTEQCDDSGQCKCKPGVGGLKCDRCEPGYWGLPRIGTTGHSGCIPCGCSAFGSVREDCEQMTGRCVCKPGIQGQKCTICSNHEHTLGPNGCFDPESTQLPATNCEHMTCYFGAHCLVRSGLATCDCSNKECPKTEAPSVCGSDGRTYLSACHLRNHACRTQSDIVVQAFGPCNEEPHVRREDLYAHVSTDEPANCAPKPTKKPDVREDSEDDFVNEVNEDYSTYEYFEEYSNVGYEVPLFDGQARMVARTRLPAKRFDVWAEVSAVCNEGALMSAAGTRDHVWLGFVQNKAVLRWDAGSGPFELHTGKVKIDGRQKISARRYKKDAMLKLGSATASGSARGRMTSLDVDPYIYVGQPPENVTRLAGASKIPGFIGCVHRLRVSGRDLIPPARGLTFTSQGVRACTPHNLAQLVCP